MADIVFVLKCLLVTVVVVVLLQIRVGQRTVEGHAMTWLHHSTVSHHLQDVAEGAVKAGGQAKRGVASLLGYDQPVETETSTAEASREWFKIKRSAAYHRQKEREAKLARERELNERTLPKAEPTNDGLNDDQSDEAKN